MRRSEALQLSRLIEASWPAGKFHEQAGAAYADALRDLDYDQACQAVKLLHAEVDWVPSISQIRRTALQGVAKPDAGAAFAEVIDQMRKVGSWNRPTFSNPVIGEVVSRLGGWVQCCSTWNEAEMQWRRKEFITEFEQLAERAYLDATYAAQLAASSEPRLLGRHEQNSRTADGPMALGDLLARRTKALSEGGDD